MICTTCKKPVTNGKIVGGKITCNNCTVNEMAKSLVKRGQYESSIITVLKRHGVRGDVAYGYYMNPEYTLERLIKTVWLFRYIKSTGYKVANDTAFMNVLLRNKKYPPSDEFYEYVKEKQAKYDGKDFDILYRSI